MMNIAIILGRHYPDQEWTLNGDDYAGLVWLSDTPKPTEAALVKAWPSVQSEIAAEAQARLDAKASTIDKLKALGLTVEEVTVAFGLSK